MEKILVALCGKNPQIITETLYALDGRHSFPHSVFILTTEAGRDLCLDLLLDSEHGKLPALLRCLKIHAPQLLQAKNILIPFSGKKTVTDLHTEKDSRLFLELCLQTVFTLSQNSDCELIFSIAGGRKTMSAALVLAAQCYARPQDSMFHILVPQELESNPNFFYPSGNEITPPLILTPVPFFRMREHLPVDFLQSPATLESLSYVCMPKEPLYPSLDFDTHTLSCNGRSLHLPPALLAVYAFFVLQKTECPYRSDVCPENCSACALTWPDVASKLDEIHHIYQCVEGRTSARGQTGIVHLSAANFRSSLSKLKKMLIQVFGHVVGTRLSILSTKKAQVAEYCLRIPRRQIFINSQRCDH